MTPMIATAQHTTPFGTMWSNWTERGLFSLQWQQPTLDVAAPFAERKARRLERALQDFFAGDLRCLDEIEIDAQGWSPFAAGVYQCCRSITAGSTVSYRTLATIAGNPKASRAVGAAMSRNRILLVIPCHRVIASDGSLGGFSGAGGLDTKRRLIQWERAAEAKPTPARARRSAKSTASN